MKNKSIIILMVFILSSSFAFSQTWSWANSAGGSYVDYESALEMCVDFDDNVYVTGLTRGPVAYFNTDSIPINGTSDIFIAKYDVNGNELWVKCFGSNYNGSLLTYELGAIISYDSITNSIYVAGSILGNCIIGNDTLIGFPSGEEQIFLARFDSNGNCIWARSEGGSGRDFSSSLVINNEGGVILTGILADSSNIDSFFLQRGGFIASYDSIGNCNWAKKIINEQTNLYGSSGWIISMDYFQNGYYFIAQKYSDTLIIDTISIIGFNSISIVLGKFDMQGNVLFAKVIVSSKVSTGNLEIDKFGNFYIYGNSRDTVTFFQNDTVHSAFMENSFIAKIDSLGDLLWARQSTSDDWILADGLSTDEDGNSYFSGTFQGNCTFDGSISASTVTQDIFIMRYNSAGSNYGLVYAGQGENCCIKTLSNGSCVMAGNFSNAINLGNTSLTSRGNYDILVARLDGLAGLEDIERKSNQSLYIYGNPSTGKCNIKVPDDLEIERNLVLSIYAMSGKLIRQIPIETENGEIKVNIEAEAKGIYNAILTNGKRSYSGKIVFE